MKLIDKDFLVIVHVSPEDIERFNSEEHTNIPADKEALFGFIKHTGEFKRVIPNSIRKYTSWERLRARAHNYLKENSDA